MKIVLFCHSLLSDWNHGNAHFLRGLCTELSARGHDVRVLEPTDAWSVQNLVRQEGPESLKAVYAHYPLLRITRYDTQTLDLDHALDGADLVLVHEWNEPQLVAAIGRHRAHPTSRYSLLFNDTHHRSVTKERELAVLDLSNYDGVLAFGEAVRQRYLDAGWNQRVWTFHEAADVRVFRPLPAERISGDLVWIGNFGDDERTRELREFLLQPAQRLGLKGSVYGVRYPQTALNDLALSGLSYAGWLPNYAVAEVFASHRVTVHIPRRPYVEALPGVPTIRVFEALACGIPLVCAPWHDSEGLFEPGDYLSATNTAQMCQHLQTLLHDASVRQELAQKGLRTILARHTCAHRADQLLEIVEGLGQRAVPTVKRTPNQEYDAWG